MSPLLCHGTLHEEHQKDERGPHHGAHPEHVEVGQRRGLLLAEVVQHLYGHLPRLGRIAGVLQEESMPPIQERVHVGVQRCKTVAQPRKVELLAAFLDGLGHRRADAAPLVAEQSEQADSGPAQT